METIKGIAGSLFIAAIFTVIDFIQRAKLFIFNLLAINGQRKNILNQQFLSSKLPSLNGVINKSFFLNKRVIKVYLSVFNSSEDTIEVNSFLIAANNKKTQEVLAIDNYASHHERKIETNLENYVIFPETYISLISYVYIPYGTNIEDIRLSIDDWTYQAS